MYLVGMYDCILNVRTASGEIEALIAYVIVKTKPTIADSVSITFSFNIDSLWKIKVYSYNNWLGKPWLIFERDV